MRTPTLLSLCVLPFAPACRYADAASLDYSELEIERLASAPAACAGLVFGAEGDGFLSSGTALLRFETQREDGGEATPELVRWAELGAPRGHAILADGTHVVCDGPRLLRIAQDGEHTDVLVGAGLSAPHDLCIAPGGAGVFVTDAGALLHVALANGDATVLDRDLVAPTGIALSPDARTLYVADGAHVLAYRVAGADTVADRRELAALPGGEPAVDLCVDADGFVWIARGEGIDVVGAEGRYVVRIPTPPVQSLAFGDPSLRVLYFGGGEPDGGGALGRAFVGVRGAPLPAQQDAARAE